MTYSSAYPRPAEVDGLFRLRALACDNMSYILYDIKSGRGLKSDGDQSSYLLEVTRRGLVPLRVLKFNMTTVRVDV